MGGTGTGTGRNRRWSGPWAGFHPPHACHRPGSPSAPPGPRVPTWRESMLLYVTVTCVEVSHRPKKEVIKLGYGVGSRGARPHPTPRALSGRLRAVSRPGTGTGGVRGPSL